MNGYLIDTNTFSEGIKKRPNKGVIAWLEAIDQQQLFTSCLVVGELYRGVELAKNHDHRAKLETFAENIVESFAQRILLLDVEACQIWAKLFVDAQKIGKTPPSIDSLLAAQAIQHNLTLVTRNLKDFEQFSSLKILSPWTNTTVS